MNLLELLDVRKSFGSVEAISDVNLEVSEGSFHSVIGPNGAGKSTLFNLISGELPLTSGTIRYRGAPISGWSSSRIARAGIGRSFQKTSLFWNLSVAENIRLAALGASAGPWPFVGPARVRQSEAMQRLLEEVGLEGVAEVPACELAHGDQRVLELAVTLAMQPTLLLMDEPTCGMSATECRRMIQLVRKMCRGRTVLLVEHNMDIVMTLSDRVTVLQFGRVIADGSPAEIARNADVRKAYLGSRH
jgi:branched-chain amino acid transport system ATP-binding protein